MGADKILKIQRELDETKVVLHKTIDSVLARGEKLDNLVDKSTNLSMASQMFYKRRAKAGPVLHDDRGDEVAPTVAPARRCALSGPLPRARAVAARTI